MNTCVLLQGQVGHSRGDSERRGGRRRGKSRRGEWVDAFLQYVRGGMLSWCWQTCWCWNADAQPHLSGDGGRVGSDPAASEVPKGLRARQQTFHLTADHHLHVHEHRSPSPTSRSRISSVVWACLCLLTVLTVTLRANLSAGYLETSNCDLSLLVRLSILVKIQKI